MAALSQSDLDKIVSGGREAGQVIEPLSHPAAGPLPRFQRFAGLYSKDIATDPYCSLSQDEVDRVLGKKS